MGSLPEGKRCCYCDVRKADSIPDGAVGPIYIGSLGSCFKVWEKDGYEKISRLRRDRLLRMRVTPLCRSPPEQMPSMLNDIDQTVAKCLWYC